MVDSMHQPNSSDPLVQEHNNNSSLSSTIEKCIGEFNWPQFLQAIFISFSWFFDGQQSFITIFTDAAPPWHCIDDSSSSSCINKCSLPKDSWVWDKPKQTSIISEWGLDECDDNNNNSSLLITGLPASMFFAGCLIGGLALATLADSSLGRKNMLLFPCLLMSLSSLFASFSSNVWVYSALKFQSGFGRAPIGTSALVLATELVAKKWRGPVCVFGFFLFSSGFFTLPPLAYANRYSSWRNLYLWTSIPSILYCVLVYFFVLESPRWLLIRGRKEEAVRVLKSINTHHSDNIDLNLSMNICSMSPEGGEVLWNNMDLLSALKMMMQRKWSLKRVLAVVTMGLGMGLVYYGMPLGLGILSFNLYLSVTFNALSEMVSSLLTWVPLDRFNRRSALFFLTIMSGVTSVLSIMEGGIVILTRLQIVLELVSFFCACTAYEVVLIYTTELFPTCVRNSALALVRQAVALGGVSSPMLAAAGREHKFICFGFFGLAIGCSGMFVVCLPETKGKAFCDTMDEEEEEENKEKVVEWLR